MNKLRAYFRVICAPIRPSIFCHSRQANCFRRPEISSRRPEISNRRPEISSQWPEILYRLVNMYQLKILTCPPWCRCPRCLPLAVDNYISIFLLKTVTGPRYWNGRGISRPNVEMNCNDILCDIFSGARGMLKSLRNHRQSQRPNGKKWRIVGGRCWEKNSLSWPLNRLQLCLHQQAGGTRSEYNYWRRKGLTEQ